jgi:hypothetical protein
MSNKKFVFVVRSEKMCKLDDALNPHVRFLRATKSVPLAVIGGHYCRQRLWHNTNNNRITLHRRLT